MQIFLHVHVLRFLPSSYLFQHHHVLFRFILYGWGVAFDILLEYLVCIASVGLIKLFFETYRQIIFMGCDHKLSPNDETFFLSMIDFFFFNLPPPLITRTKQIKKPEIEHRTSSVSSLSYDHGSIPGGCGRKESPPTPFPLIPPVRWSFGGTRKSSQESRTVQYLDEAGEGPIKNGFPQNHRRGVRGQLGVGCGKPIWQLMCHWKVTLRTNNKGRDTVVI
ncbi:hypothetical protein CDAR_53901 [Caerostris darwini]|uniref:Uncharacterized protein n=1 Tax=Caerostris darwini TaxID=1538125 RepID=A0AAV4WFL7_9ARAC|nr:hypothetical protein CDAR_53901 [Caerostris darwini]